MLLQLLLVRLHVPALVLRRVHHAHVLLLRLDLRRLLLVLRGRLRRLRLRGLGMALQRGLCLRLLAHGLLRIEMLLPHLPSHDKQCQAKVGKREGGVLRTMCCIHAPVDTHTPGFRVSADRLR